jgi:adenosine deaminase
VEGRTDGRHRARRGPRDLPQSLSRAGDQLNDLTRNPSSTDNVAHQIAAVPKISLHDHLDGGIRLNTILELSREIGRQPPSDTPKALAEWVNARANSGSLEGYLEVDDLNTPLLRTPEALERVAHERVVDLALEGVIYCELRWAPEQLANDRMGMLAATRAVHRGLLSGMYEASRGGRHILAAQILCGLRDTSGSLAVARIATKAHDLAVVGLDMAGPEAGFPLRGHSSTFDLAAAEFLPITIHAGEAAGVESIAEALVIGRACRIGHGARLIDDIRLGADRGDLSKASLGQTASWVRDRQIPLELCPTSNIQTGAAMESGGDLARHPFNILYRLGFAVTVSPDNATVSSTSVTEENSRISATFGYSVKDVIQFQLNAARAAFQPLDVRRHLERRIQHHLDSGITGMNKTIPEITLSGPNADFPSRRHGTLRAFQN